MKVLQFSRIVKWMLPIALLLLFFTASHSNVHAAQFSFDAAGNCSSQSATLTSTLLILKHPVSQVISPGGSVSVSVNVSSGSPVTYQWYKDGVMVANATEDSYLVPDASALDSGEYWVRVSTQNHSVTSNRARLYILDDPGKYLFWNAASGALDVPGNWDQNRVPGQNDIAIIDAGSFSFPSSGVLQGGEYLINVPYIAPTNGDINIQLTGNCTFTGFVKLQTNYWFTLNGGRLNFTGPTELHGANLAARQGGKITFEAYNSYALPPTGTVTWEAKGVGSELNFPSLTIIQGSLGADSFLVMEASLGGTINLPSLRTITVEAESVSAVKLVALSEGVLMAPLLSIFRDYASNADSEIIRSDGILQLKALNTWGLTGVNLDGLVLPEGKAPLPNVRLIGGYFKLSLPTYEGRSYQLVQKNDLATVEWLSVGEPISGNDDEIEYWVPITADRNFFRVEISPK